MRNSIILMCIFLFMTPTMISCSPQEQTAQIANSSFQDWNDSDSTTNTTPLIEENTVPNSVSLEADKYVKSLIPSPLYNDLKLVDSRYEFTGVEREVTDTKERDFYINKVQYSGGYITQCFNDSDYGKVCVTIANGDKSVAYKTQDKVYKFNYNLSFILDSQQESILIEFNVLESGQIYKTYYNTLNECEQDKTKCPPFKISRAKAKEIITPKINLKEGYSISEPRLIYYRNIYWNNPNKFSGYIWQVNYCAPPYNGPPPPPLGSGCQAFKINAYNGESVE